MKIGGFSAIILASLATQISRKVLADPGVVLGDSLAGPFYVLSVVSILIGALMTYLLYKKHEKTWIWYLAPLNILVTFLVIPTIYFCILWMLGKF